ncbi:MAG: GNAT family N-acetyltransferase [Ferruginibacter sp.]
MLEPDFTSFPVLTTERLILRQIDAADAPQILALRSSELVMKYINKERAKNLEDAMAFVERVNTGLSSGEGITWGMALKEAPEKLIGTIGLWRIIKQHYRAEIGYMLHPDLWGKGYTNEAIKAVIDCGFTTIQLHSIEAHINPGNAASAGLLESNGFVREAYFKEDYFYEGQFLDSAIYSLLNKAPF